MYKVFLVDDEPLVLEGLKLLVDWETHGFEICGEARDGEEALQAIGQIRPDLVVTDIRMPVMSGLELIRQARESLNSDSHFIVLSGYSDFSYAHTAMRYEATDYLLKPIDSEEFDRALRKLRADLDKHRQAALAKANEKLAFARYSLTMLVQGMESSGIAQQAANRLGIGPDTEVCVILAEERLADHRESVQRAIEDVTAGGADMLLFPFDDGIGRTGLIAAGKPANVVNVLSNLRANIAKHAAADVWLYVSDWGLGPSYMHKLYEQAVQLRDNRPFGTVLLAEEVYGVSHSDSDEPVPAIVMDYEDELVRFMESGDPQSITEAVDSLFARLYSEGTPPSVARAIASDLSVVLLRRYPSSDTEMDRSPNTVSTALPYAGIRELQSTLVRLCVNASEKLGRSEKKPMVAEAVRIVKERFRKPLKLRDLAEELQYQPAYLGQLFKKETGVSFHEFLNTTRIEEAKSLLRRTDMKIAEVAKNVGFSDAEDFSRQFKSIAGMPPSAYKNQAKRGS
ncbi:response regulator transcription factor [Paenibacillus kobensis]|uniref:response regulator transcription factor n=1 Tax=Paenibacillus kobensis TaxID=59841 RepID=UPI0013E318E9|nr:response regulator transcription factor [Paenibacillus kobensis]